MKEDRATDDEHHYHHYGEEAIIACQWWLSLSKVPLHASVNTTSSIVSSSEKAAL
jgi:hypothetical protein